MVLKMFTCGDVSRASSVEAEAEVEADVETGAGLAPRRRLCVNALPCACASAAYIQHIMIIPTKQPSDLKSTILISSHQLV